MPIPLVCPLLGAGTSCIEKYCAWWIKDEEDGENKGCCFIQRIAKSYEYED